MLEKNKVVRQKILGEIERGYEAVTDGPACFFVDDWVEMFPDAKVCFVPFVAWFTSCSFHLNLETTSQYF